MSNYENPDWPKIYDRMYEDSSLFRKQRAFYWNEITDKNARVLEIACGTGLLTLDFLKAGFDIYGFDISPQMIAKFKEKAKADGVEASHRISVQNMLDFYYPFTFDTIFLPSRSLLHITDQQEQIRCLRRIRSYLKPHGRFIVNFFNPNLRLIAEKQKKEPAFTFQGHYTGDDGIEIELRAAQSNDTLNQTQDITWRFLYGQQQTSQDQSMRIRWIYSEEFKLLLQLAGFSEWKIFGDFDRSPLTAESPEQIWIVRR
jgi:SAM-dependent methyltransferase